LINYFFFPSEGFHLFPFQQTRKKAPEETFLATAATMTFGLSSLGSE